MKTSCSSLVKVFRVHGPWIAALLLCQCSMPPRQAWQYIQHNGLLTYWSYEANRPSPPFGAGASYSQRYAAPGRSLYPPPRYSPQSYWGAPMPRRIPYQAAPRTDYPSRYFATPSQPATPAPRLTPQARPERPAPRVTPRLSAEEPSQPGPAVVKNEPSSQPSSPAPSVPMSSNSPAASSLAPSDLPYGTAVPGRPNMVNSPYAAKTQLVDVSGMGPGQTVKCPYTGRLFRVPPAQQAANHAEPALESKNDSPKASTEPKTDNKPKP